MCPRKAKRLCSYSAPTADEPAYRTTSTVDVMMVDDAQNRTADESADETRAGDQEPSPLKDQPQLLVNLWQDIIFPCTPKEAEHLLMLRRVSYMVGVAK